MSKPKPTPEPRSIFPYHVTGPCVAVFANGDRRKTIAINRNKGTQLFVVDDLASRGASTVLLGVSEDFAAAGWELLEIK